MKMAAIKLAPLKPVDMSPKALERSIGVDYIVVQKAGPGNYGAYGKQRQSPQELMLKIKEFAKRKNLILIEGNSGIGKNEMMGKPFVQFLLKEKPAKKIAKNPQAMPGLPTGGFVNSGETPSQLAKETPEVAPKQGPKRFQNVNRLGWSKDAYDSFVAMTKPGGVSQWSIIKKQYKNPVERDAVADAIHDLYMLFGDHATYKPLMSMFAQLGGIYDRATFDLEKWKQKYGSGGGSYAGDQAKHMEDVTKMIARIEPRLQRLWHFAREQKLASAAKSIVIKKFNRRLI